jgi:hypothetical protein
MNGADLMRRAGELKLHKRQPRSRGARIAAMVRRAAADLEHSRRVEQRRRRIRRLAVVGFVVGTGAAVILGRMGMPHRS